MLRQCAWPRHHQCRKHSPLILGEASRHWLMSTVDAPPNQGSPAATNALAAPPARIFLGTKGTTEIAHELAQIAAGLKEQSVRPVAPADIHLTLVPPWSEASIPEAVEKLRLVARKFGAIL